MVPRYLGTRSFGISTTRQTTTSLRTNRSSNTSSVTSKKSPNVYKSCPKIFSLEKCEILTPSQKLPKNIGDLGKLNIAKGFEKLPKVQ